MPTAPEHQYIGALYYAVQTNDIDFTNQLISTGIDISRTLADDTLDLINFAISNDSSDVLSSLIQADILAGRPPNKQTLLKTAIDFQSINVIRFVLKLGCPDETCNDNTLINKEPKILDLLEMYDVIPDIQHCLHFSNLYGYQQKDILIRLLKWKQRTDSYSEIVKDVVDIIIKNDWHDVMNLMIINLGQYCQEILATTVEKAVQFHAVRCIKLLLSIQPTTITSCYSYIETLCIIDKASEIELIINRSNLEIFDESLLICAAEFGSSDSVKMLLRRGFKPSQHTLDTSLLKASHYENSSIVKMLLDAGADVNYCNTGSENSSGLLDCKNPLSVACYHGNNEIVTELLQHGAILNFADNNISVFTAACDSGDSNILKQLLAFSDTSQCNLERLLHYACVTSKPNIVEVLLKYSHVNSHDCIGSTPLMQACKSKRNDVDSLTICNLLINAGAIVNTQNKDGDNPLCLSCCSGKIPTISFLLERGATLTTFVFLNIAKKLFRDGEIILDGNTVLHIVKILCSKLNNDNSNEMTTVFSTMLELTAKSRAALVKYYVVFIYVLQSSPCEVVDSFIVKHVGPNGIWKIDNSPVSHLDGQDHLTTAQLCGILSNLFDFCSYAKKCRFPYLFERYLFKWRSQNPFILTFAIQKLCGILSTFFPNTLAFQGVLHDVAFVKLLLNCGCHARDIRGVFKYWYGRNVFQISADSGLTIDRIKHIERVRQLLSQPVCLQALCRTAIRKEIFKASKLAQFSHLHIPQHMKRYLAMSN